MGSVNRKRARRKRLKERDRKRAIEREAHAQAVRDGAMVLRGERRMITGIDWAKDKGGGMTMHILKQHGGPPLYPHQAFYYDPELFTKAVESTADAVAKAFHAILNPIATALSALSSTRLHMFDLQNFITKACALRWLDNLEHGIYPWCYGEGDAREPALWVVACYVTAWERKQVIDERDSVRWEGKQTMPLNDETSKAWSAFLLLAAKDEELWRAIDGVACLGSSSAQAVRYVGEAFDLLASKLSRAPRLLAIQARQETRMRRLQGRAARLPDEAWEREAITPVRLPARRKV